MTEPLRFGCGDLPDHMIPERERCGSCEWFHGVCTCEEETPMTARDVIDRTFVEFTRRRQPVSADDILAALAADGWRVVKLEQPGTGTTRLMLCQNEYTAWDSDDDLGVPLYVITEEATPLVTKTGKVLTDEDVEALADEAERGYVITCDVCGAHDHNGNWHRRYKPEAT